MGVATTYRRPPPARERSRVDNSRVDNSRVDNSRVDKMKLSFMFQASGAGCLLALAAIFAAGGCKSTPEDRQPATVLDVQQPVDAVEDIVRRAEAASDDAQRARYYLRALERLHDAGDVARAKGMAETMRGREIGQPASIADALAPEARFRFDAIGLDLALESGNIDEVDRLLAVLKPQGLNQERQAMRLRARTLSAVGNVASAAETLMALAEVSTDPDTVEALAGSIWRHLTALPVLESRTRAEAAASASARAWWTLAHDFNAALTRRGQVRAWQRWRSLHTDHPATRYPPPALVRTERDPDQLALLVPVTGDLGAAGEAVRDGFLAAYLHAGSVARRVHVYDTDAMSVRAAYDLALRQGAEVIVGPLQKAEVAALSALTPTVPVIALNHLDAGAPRSEFVVQFSLAVEDQALAIADALEADGVERIVLFDSPARWSSRARVRLEDELDGVEAVGFGTFHRVGQVTNTVGDALHVTESKTRARAIESLLGTQFEFTARRRDDVDAVVALVDADELLSLKPALEFHFAGDLPVYAPATATLDGVDLSRLEGLRVCAIPWMLDPGALGAAVKAGFPASRGSYASLFALGVDGFRLANQFARLTVHREPIPANTGVLSLGDDGRIRRELVWATVRGGRLVPLFRNRH